MSEFTIYPAIDLRGGQVVRLKEGDPARQTAYSNNPAEMARRWLSIGASWLHVINLDGAFGESDAANQEALRAILNVADEFGAQPIRSRRSPGRNNPVRSTVIMWFRPAGYPT